MFGPTVYQAGSILGVSLTLKYTVQFSEQSFMACCIIFILRGEP